jgi:tetratricopeptide (TPR) repeat protein
VQVLANLGWDTGDEYDALERLLKMGCELDQVVLVYCLNDIADIVPEWQHIFGRISEKGQNQNWLVRHSYLADILYYRLKARRDPNIQAYYGFLTTAYRGPLWEEQKVRLKLLRDRVEANGGHLLVVTFPFLHAPLDERYEFRSVHQRLDECWRALNVPHLDLLPVYQGHPPGRLVVNHLDAHPNELAHKLAADALQKFLSENITARRNAPITNSHLAHDAPGAAPTQEPNWNEAIRNYELAVKSDPNSAQAHNNLGIALAVAAKWKRRSGNSRKPSA